MPQKAFALSAALAQTGHWWQNAMAQLCAFLSVIHTTGLASSKRSACFERRLGYLPTVYHVLVEPDYCFDPAEWEFTCDWSDRDQAHGHGDGLNRSEPMRVCTLMKRPDKWMPDVPVTWDEHCDPDETEIKWFDSEEEARVALATTEGSDNG